MSDTVENIKEPVEAPLERSEANKPKQKKKAAKRANKQKITYARDANGLLKGVKYAFNKDGTVDWRAMIPSKFIVLNDERVDVSKIEDVEEYKKTAPDHELLVLLMGWRELARLRGFTQANPTCYNSNLESSTIGMQISWIPNFENPEGASMGAIANASVNTTNGHFSNFIDTIAENRAFVRAVRNFLNIPLLGKDELPAGKHNSNHSASSTFTPPMKGSNPRSVIQSFLDNKNISMESFKAQLSKSDFADSLTSDYANWQTVDNIPIHDALTLIERLNKKKKDTAAK